MKRSPRFQATHRVNAAIGLTTAALVALFGLTLLPACGDDSDDRQSQACVSGFPASGQTTAYGTGSDGDVRAGAALSYTDNGDGTITDNNTGLMWEKKDDSGGLHDKDNFYTWGMTDPPYEMNGTMLTQFLLVLNQEPCFAEYCDWRIPNVRELQSIVDYQVVDPGPTVSAAFHNAAGCPGCADVTVASCSCTASYYYWSSTTGSRGANYAWLVDFTFGGVFNVYGIKNNLEHVRAVRGGG